MKSHVPLKKYWDRACLGLKGFFVVVGLALCCADLVTSLYPELCYQLLEVTLVCVTSYLISYACQSRRNMMLSSIFNSKYVAVSELHLLIYEGHPDSKS